MKKWILPAAALIVGASFSTPYRALAIESEQEDVIAHEEAKSESVKDRSEWMGVLKDKYKLSDEQIQKLKDSGLSNPQMAIAAGLADKSGKSIDDVLKMRTEQKMGWGKIAKELGVHPSEIGHAVSSARHEMKDQRQEDRKADKAAEKAERKVAKTERKANKAAEKALKRAERSAKKDSKHE